MTAVIAPAGEAILEIGPGLGVLTREISRLARSVTAVEISRRLEPILAANLEDRSNVRVIWNDFLQCTTSELGEDETWLAVGNLPYSIATPAIFRFLDGEIRWKRIVCMVQAEVAERMVAPHGNKRYGALSIGVQSAASVRIIRTVPPSAFWPRPKVTSAILEMVPARRLELFDRSFLKRVLASAFSSRRKTMKNALRTFPNAGEAMRLCGISHQNRPEQISVDGWLSLLPFLER